MTSTAQDDRRSRRRAAWWIVVPLAVLVGVNVLVLVAADRDDDRDDAATSQETAPGATGSGQVVTGTGEGAVDGGAQGSDGSSGAPGDGSDLLLPGGLPTDGRTPRLTGATATAQAGALPPDISGPAPGERPHGAGLNLTSTVDGPLTPGEPRVLTLTVRNGHPWPVHLLRADVNALTADVAPACNARWISSQRYRYATDGDRIVIGPQISVQLRLGIELLDLDVNQNACKGVDVPLQLTAVAAEVTG